MLARRTTLQLLLLAALASPAFAELHRDLNFLLDLYSAAACRGPATAEAAASVRATLLRDGMLNIRSSSACWTLEEWQGDPANFYKPAPPDGTRSIVLVSITFDSWTQGMNKRYVNELARVGTCTKWRQLCGAFARKSGAAVLGTIPHDRNDFLPPLVGAGPGGFIISTLAGNGTRGSSPDGTPAPQAMLNNPNGVATDSDGNIYIADAPTHTIKMVRSSDGKMVVFAGRVGVRGFSGDGGLARTALLNTPRGVGVDGRDLVYICDSVNNRIRVVNRTSGVITTFAGSGASAVSATDVGDGGPAVAAKLANPRFVVFDSQNNLYWSDVDAYRVRSVDIATGIIRTVVGTGVPGKPTLGDASVPARAQPTSAVRGLAVDGRSNTLYFSDTSNHQVLRIGADGALQRVAGTGAPGFEQANTAADASPLYSPFGLAFDEDVGILYVCDTENNVVRYVNPATNTIGLFAGTGKFGFSGDGGRATLAQLYNTQALALDKRGGRDRLLLADSSNARVRAVNATLSAQEVAP